MQCSILDLVGKKGQETGSARRGTGGEPARKRKTAPEPEQELPKLDPTRPSLPFGTLSKYWEKIEQTSKRLEKLRLLTGLLLEVYLTFPDDLLTTILLTTNQLREPWSELPKILTFADSNLQKAVAQTFNTDLTRVRTLVKEKGDLGDVAQALKATMCYAFVKPKELTVNGVYSKLLLMADTMGSRSLDEKSKLISDLLFNGSSLDTRYVCRLVLGKFRLGMQKKTVIASLADFLCGIILCYRRKVSGVSDVDKLLDAIYAYGKITQKKHLDEKEVVSDPSSDLTEVPDGDADGDGDDDDVNLDPINQVEQKTTAETRDQEQHLLITDPHLRQLCHGLVDKAYSFCPSLEVLVQTFMTNTEEKIQGILNAVNSITIRPGVPIQVMLAKAAASYDEVHRAVGESTEFLAEYKYDGYRAQVHYDATTGCRRLFARSLEDMSKRFPEVISTCIEAFEAAGGGSSFILDGEICAVDPENGAILPFQLLSRRSKNASEEKNTVYPTVLFVFDLLYLNQEDQLSVGLLTRQEHLRTHFKALPRRFEYATGRLFKGIDDLGCFLEEAVQARTEGLIIKLTHGSDSYYRPDERSHAWLKLKKDYLDACGDSFDLVPIAAWMGAGKRTNFFGAYLLAAYNENTDCWETVCQLGTGFSDAYLIEMHTYFQTRCLPEKHRTVSARPSKAPDAWFDPEDSVVWEVRCANLSLSTVHTLCWSQYEEGRGIALRLPRLIRSRGDKKPMDCTKADVIAHAFAQQPERLGTTNEAI
ncbi:DNA ligase (ATP) [Giardia muris]|uniref:DNA ligase 1 n=1 Tax=Giardia muris TaxID=5742 RepID=A0A4Z1SXR2_GIAMU|nr:DNA ligase (ATP) [Giardia muris]|eukprot:TNJ26473.1 DNA ligase (ATP) [Giardia muris]